MSFCSGTPICNCLEEEDDEEVDEDESSEKIQENEDTRAKMRSLRNKMESMSLSKKVCSLREIEPLPFFLTWLFVLFGLFL